MKYIPKKGILCMMLGFGLMQAQEHPESGSFFIKNNVCHNIQVKVKAKFESGWSFETLQVTKKVMMIPSNDQTESPPILFENPCAFEVLVRKAYSNKDFQRVWHSKKSIESKQYCGATLLITHKDGCYHAEWCN